MFQCIEKVFEDREWNDYTVCGSNGVTYRHKWELDHHNCQHDESLKVRNPGPCRGGFFMREVANQECNFCAGKQSGRKLCGSDLRMYNSMCELDLMNCLDQVGCKIRKTGLRKCKRLSLRAPKQVYYCDN